MTYLLRVVLPDRPGTVRASARRWFATNLGRSPRVGSSLYTRGACAKALFELPGTSPIASDLGSVVPGTPVDCHGLRFSFTSSVTRCAARPDLSRFAMSAIVRETLSLHQPNSTLFHGCHKLNERSVTH